MLLPKILTMISWKVTLADGTQKESAFEELEEKGTAGGKIAVGATSNIPTMADIACGKWGRTSERTQVLSRSVPKRG